MPTPLLAPVRGHFRLLATTFVPEAAALDEAAWSDVERIVEDALALRPPRLRRQVVLLIRLLDVLPLLRYGRRLSRLDVPRRLAFLGALERAPLLLARRGVWAVRTLAFMGYYGRPEGAAAVGYRADVRGWGARR